MSTSFHSLIVFKRLMFGCRRAGPLWPVGFMERLGVPTDRQVVRKKSKQKHGFLPAKVIPFPPRPLGTQPPPHPLCKLGSNQASLVGEPAQQPASQPLCKVRSCRWFSSLSEGIRAVVGLSLEACMLARIECQIPVKGHY
jgi:hypothetical protein